MRRREFITLLGGAAAAWPLAARAQQTGKVLRIGFLFTGSLESPEGRLSIDALRQGLHQHGYIEDQNIVVEYRAAEGRFDRLPALASELVQLKVDVILATATPAGRATQRATTTIPIVVTAMGDPVQDGLVASIARPGGNITGTTFLGPELVPKRLALLKEGLPTLSHVGILWHPGAFGEATIRNLVAEVTQAAKALSLQPHLAATRNPDEIDGAFASIIAERAQAVFVKQGAARLGFDPSTFGGHSLRAGFVTSAVKRGANLIKITDVTGHRSLEMLKTYSRDAEAFVGHAGAGLL